MSENLLRRPEFWAVHYYGLLWDDEHDWSEMVERIFGVTADAANRFYADHLVHPDDDHQPPRILLPLFDGFAVRVDFVDGGEGDGHEVRYALDRETWQEPELLGYDSGHHALPAFRWVEIDALSRALRETGHTEVESATALLVLYPSVWLTRADDPAQVAKRLSEAWSALEFLRIRDPAALVSCCTAGTVDDLIWRQDVELGWINDGGYSLRNPPPHLSELPAFAVRRYRRLREFLSSVEQKVGPIG